MTSFERAVLISRACKAIHTESQWSEEPIAAALRKYRRGKEGSRW